MLHVHPVTIVLFLSRTNIVKQIPDHGHRSRVPLIVKQFTHYFSAGPDRPKTDFELALRSGSSDATALGGH